MDLVAVAIVGTIEKKEKDLESWRLEMLSIRFDSHHHILDTNKDAIQYLDKKIEENLQKKLDIIYHYAKATIKQSLAIINGESLSSNCSNEEVDNEIQSYDIELSHLQQRRANLWDSFSEFHDYLFDQEKQHNQRLDEVYQQFLYMLPKIYHYHNNTSPSKLGKINLFPAFYKNLSCSSYETFQKEIASRETVSALQRTINDRHECEDLIEMAGVSGRKSVSTEGEYQKLEC